MPDLNAFLRTYRISTDALGRIRNRVFIVGRFNNRQQGPDPDVYLFTDRDVSKDYENNFSGVTVKKFSVTFESFVEALKPAIAEEVVNIGPFPSVRQTIPTGVKQSGTSIIDQYNYFFQRAAATSGQPDYRPGTRQGEEEPVLNVVGKERGKEILRQIRKNLRTFCEYQPKTYHLIEYLADLLQSCTGYEGFPREYVAGHALPNGFPERLIDFLYSENTEKSFSEFLGGVTFEGTPWENLARDAAAREAFCNVVNAFRAVLVFGKADQFRGVMVLGNKSLKDRAEEAVTRVEKDAGGNEKRTTQEPAAEFKEARAAFNGLRQTLRSKVLLSMILEWLVDSLFEIPAVKKLERNKARNTEANRYEAISNAILRDYAANELAAPKRRPSERQREEFAEQLTANFEKLLDLVVADAEPSAEALAALPHPELRDLLGELRRDTALVDTLRIVSGGKDKEMQRAFRDAAKAVIVDVMCPVLYSTPILNVQQLKKYFRQQTTAAYLTAIFYSDRNQDKVREIAENHLAFFEEQIDKQSLAINNVGKIQKLLLGDYVHVLSDKRLKKDLEEGLRVLREVQALLDAADADSMQGAGSITAMRPSAADAKGQAEVEDPLKRTTSGEATIVQVIQARTARAVERTLEQAKARAADKAPAEVAPAPPDAGAQAAPKAPPPAAPAADGTTQADTEPPAESIRQIDAIVNRILAANPPTKAEMDDAERQEIVEKVTQEAMADTRFVGGLVGQLQAFEKTLHLIYSRYAANPDKTAFRNKVERLTLINMMLLNQKDLGFGEVMSNLFQMLLDLIQNTDPDSPNALKFLRKYSLTLYFDDAKLDETKKGNGFAALKKTLEIQADESLQSLVSFVSELRGIKHLFDKVQAANDPGAEIVVVNATAAQFLAWITSDNLNAANPRAKGRLRCGRLVEGQADRVIPPALVYLTDAAFGATPQQAKVAWLKAGSAGLALQQAGASVILPPLCLCASADDNWQKQGDDLVAAAAGFPAPVVVLGPSPRLNDPADSFPTYLPAGYLFAAHMLGAPDQGITIPNQTATSTGRFRKIGYSSAPMRESLDQTVWREPNDAYAFAADFYLYLILQVLGTGLRSGIAPPADVAAEVAPDAFYSCFYFKKGDADNPPNQDAYESSAVLDGAVLGGEALRFALANRLAAGTPLGGVFVGLNAESIRKWAGFHEMADVGWFNRARRAAGLP
jgi:hypothetical protein